MIQLSKLPDRSPVKVTISITPALCETLRAYATFYEQEYGVEEPITELIPAIVASFLDRDRTFQKTRGLVVNPAPHARAGQADGQA